MSKKVTDDYILPKQLDGSLREILVQNRGIDDIDNFFSPEYEKLFDPFLFRDMDAAVERIIAAIRNNEKILIYSDYDTDGIPGGVLLREFFDTINYSFIDSHIPNRNKDGYGLNMPRCQQAVEEGVSLLITIDCGIADKEEIAYLQKNNVDVIVTDHHLPESGLPNAFAVIDHKRKDNTYPEDILCGCAIAWKLVCALLMRVKALPESDRDVPSLDAARELPDGWEKWLLDLVAISTVCDMVPLVGENRILVYYGMIVLKKTRRPGLQKIMQNARIKTHALTSDDIGFGIGPRINAASRLDDPMIAFTALRNDSDAADAAMELERLNRKRKTMSATIMKSVWSRLDKREVPPAIVLGDNEWPLGILGLVAGKVADRYSRPAFVWTRISHKENVVVKGSARGGGRDVFALMQLARESFIGFGGHAASGGFEMHEEEVHFLEERLAGHVDALGEVEVEKFPIDAFLTPSEVNQQLYKEIKSFEPYGMANQKPLFLVQQGRVSVVRLFGKHEDHLEITLSDGRSSLKSIMYFYKDKMSTLPREGELLDVVGTIEENTFGYNSTIQMLIENIYHN